MVATAGIAVKKKSKRERKRLLENGPAFSMVKINTTWHIFENAAVPAGVPIYRAVCEICHHASAYLMLRIPPTVECMSCKEDRIALNGLRVQEECGVDLGWKSLGMTERRDYVSDADIRRFTGQRAR
jgi:hypothetical protein